MPLSQTSEEGDVSQQATGLSSVLAKFGRKRGQKEAGLSAGGSHCKKAAAASGRAGGKPKGDAGGSAGGAVAKTGKSPTKPGKSPTKPVQSQPQSQLEFWDTREILRAAAHWQTEASNITVEVKQGQGKKTAVEVAAADTKFMVDISSRLADVANMSDMPGTAEDELTEFCRDRCSLASVNCKSHGKLAGDCCVVCYPMLSLLFDMLYILVARVNYYGYFVWVSCFAVGFVRQALQ